MNKPNLKAEASILKGEEADATYGTKGSIRVDVFENRGNGTFCVYDVKTGYKRLTRGRMHEIATKIVEAFKVPPKRIIVTEVRPTR